MPVLVEYKMTEKVVMHMKADILQGDAMDRRFAQKNSDLLQNSSVVHRNCLQLFENAVNEFFDEVTRGRSRLLALCQQHYQLQKELLLQIYISLNLMLQLLENRGYGNTPALHAIIGSYI